MTDKTGDLGVILLVHTALDRASQVARHWAESGCPVVIHVDKDIAPKKYAGFVKSLSDLDDIRFSRRQRCEWGRWSIVGATQSAAELILQSFPDVRHVYLASGSCLPLRPIQELRSYLAQRPRTDFIESATTEDVPWTVGGLDIERFTLRFPFSWKRQRRLFDGYVRLQRKLRMGRRIPEGIVPHMGSQWWCLTRQTLSAILEDPKRKVYDRYFKRVWIPDESYFQTIVRLYSRDIESRSLTLSKFDYQGRPHIFYDDHLQLLRQSQCFVARKIWRHADLLYEEFLGNRDNPESRVEPDPSKIDRIFAKALECRTRGRTGLYMHSRFPKEGWENGLTSAPYSVFEGFSELFEGFENWLGRTTGARVHGHLFAPEKAEFAGGESVYTGGLCDSAAIRNNNPKALLANLIWNTRGERQAFQYGPDDTPDIRWFMAKDPNAQISVITGAWAVPLFHSNLNFSAIRTIAAERQKSESAFLDVLRSPYAKANVRVWTLAEFIEAPMVHLQTLIDEISPRAMRRLTEAPRMSDLAGFGQFLQNLKNHGMHPYLMGEFPKDDTNVQSGRPSVKPFVVK